MTNIILVRHGETEWNRKGIIQGRHDIPLNQTGRRQAEATMKKLKGKTIHGIFSSPLIRALETAQIIAQGLGYNAPIQTIPALRERDFGSADGKPIKPYYEMAINGKVEDMESDTALETRVMHALANLGRQHPNQTLLVVCHSHVIKAALKSIDPNRYNYHTRLFNGSIATLTFDQNRFLIQSVNNFTSNDC